MMRLVQSISCLVVLADFIVVAFVVASVTTWAHLPDEPVSLRTFEFYIEEAE